MNVRELAIRGRDAKDAHIPWGKETNVTVPIPLTPTDFAPVLTIMKQLGTIPDTISKSPQPIAITDLERPLMTRDVSGARTTFTSKHETLPIVLVGPHASIEALLTRKPAVSRDETFFLRSTAWHITFGQEGHHYTRTTIHKGVISVVGIEDQYSFSINNIQNFIRLYNRKLIPVLPYQEPASLGIVYIDCLPHFYGSTRAVNLYIPET